MPRRRALRPYLLVAAGAGILAALLPFVRTGWRGLSETRRELTAFDASAAQVSAMQAARIALVDCYQRPGPEGPGQVELRFEPGGAASGVRVLPEALSGSARGACIESVFRFEATVPAFRGASGTVLQSIDALPARPAGATYPRIVGVAPVNAGQFHVGVAGLAMARAARQVSEQCQPLPGGPTGHGKVRVEFGADGKAQKVQVQNARFHATATGECIEKIFAQVSTPPFLGSTSGMLKTFLVGPGELPSSEFDYEAAAQALASSPPPFDTAAAARALRAAALEAAACRKRDAWGWGEVELAFDNFGLVNLATLRTQRFEDTATGDCVLNAFRGARIPVFSGPASSLVQDFEVDPAISFDEVKASEDLLDAAALAVNCTSKNGPKGSLEAGVRFGPDATLLRASVVTEAFRGSVTAQCVEMVFRRANGQHFDGPAPPLFQRVEIR